jgi:hypothetical protein
MEQKPNLRMHLTGAKDGQIILAEEMINVQQTKHTA